MEIKELLRKISIIILLFIIIMTNICYASDVPKDDLNNSLEKFFSSRVTIEVVMRKC